MMVLILDSHTALEAARDGIALCVQTLIPSLFPFFVFSSLLTGSISGTGSRLLSTVERCFQIPAGSGKLLVIGLLGGYPTGAACIRQAWERGELSRNDAIRMISFCNNAGPSFLFGIIAPFFPEMKYVWMLWVIHILSALSVSFLIPGIPKHATKQLESGKITLTEALNRSIRTMASVCGWVIMFRLILTFLDRWILWIFPEWVGVILKGITELTNGCILLGQISELPLRFVITSVMIGFGGFCVLMQTKSVIGDFPLLPCIRGKIQQAGFSLLYSLHTLYFFPGQAFPLPPILLLLIDLFLFIILAVGKSRKFVVAFRRNMVYNRCNVQKMR